jgi:5'-3' exonuclease
MKNKVVLSLKKMGIKDINSFLRKNVDFEFSVPLTSFGGQRIAIDGLNWLFTYLPMVHKRVVEAQKDLLKDIDQTEIFESMKVEWMKFNIKLMNYKITPVWVWDGVSKDNKMVTKIERRKYRNELIKKKKILKEQLLSMHILARDASLLNNYKKLVLSTPYFDKENTEELKEYSKRSGLPTLIAEDEAENLASSLAVEKRISAVWSSDTDTYPLGAPIVVNSFERKNDALYIKGVSTLNILKSLGLNHQSFRDFCIMLGTDFNDRMERIGPASSLTLIKKYGNIESIAEHTKHNTYCLHAKEVRKQLTPYDTSFIEEKELNARLGDAEYPFKSKKFITFYNDFIANLRDIGNSNNLPEIKLIKK